jgi:hypothetical protein
MPLVSDTKLTKTDGSPRIQKLISEIVDILNSSGYQEKTYSAIPLAGDPGFEGEVRNCVTGATFTVCKYISGQWWQSDATALTGWSVIS